MIETRNLVVRNGEFTVQDANLRIAGGKYGVLMGKTGSGKTTLLEAICGLKRVVSGSIIVGEREVATLKPGARGIGLVPQDGALFPMLTVKEHLEFALRVRGWSAADQQRRVDELSALLQIESLLKRKPHQLSGGERQRVALGRALSFRPATLCLDEPLSALDDDTRHEMVELLKRVQRETGVTALHVTHNRSEAETLADVKLHIVAGEVMQVEKFPAPHIPLAR